MPEKHVFAIATKRRTAPPREQEAAEHRTFCSSFVLCSSFVPNESRCLRQTSLQSKPAVSLVDQGLELSLEPIGDVGMLLDHIRLF